MHNELTNLLPPDRQYALRRDYFIRLGVVATLITTCLFVAAAVLLLPTYVFLVDSAGAEKTHLASIEATARSSEEVALSEQLSMLSSNAATLSSLANAFSVSAMMRSILAISRPGVTLSGFSYSPTSSKKSGTLSISGVAVTRDSLRSYQLALQNSPLSKSADLPVSAYAKDSNIAFTITITLAP